MPSGVIGVAAAGSTLCAQTGSIVRGLTAGSGKDAWSLSGDYPNVFAAGGMFVFSNERTVSALDPATSRQRWRVELPHVKYLSSPMFASDTTTLYVASAGPGATGPEYFVLAIDAMTGDRKWATYLPLTAELSLLTAGDGQVFVLSGTDKMIGFNARTGTQEWTATGAVPFQGSITDGVICGSLFSTASKSGMVALDTATGKVLWTNDVGGNVWGSAADVGVMYTGTYLGPTRDGVPGNLIAQDVHTGKILWKRYFSEGPPTDLEPAGSVLYAGTDMGAVYAIDGATGHVPWSYDLKETGKDDLAAVVPTSEALYLASLNGALVALQV
jgi:outer membrane protein assembly factor BamB